MTDFPRPPAGLSTASRAFFRAVLGEFECSPADVRLLVVACRAHDRAEECRRQVDKDGASLVDRFGQVKAHPLLSEERQQRDLERRAIASLNFPAEAIE